MDGEATRIRGLVRAAGPRGRGVRFPAGVRRELIAFARRERSSGVAIRRIAAAAGVSTESIRRWTGRDQSCAIAGGFVPVDVRKEPTLAIGGSLSVCSPSGYRIDGLTLEQAVLMLGRLG